MIVSALAGLLIFGAAALLGILAAEAICLRIDGAASALPPAASRPATVVGICATAGACVALRGSAGPILAVGGLAAFALAGCWYCDLLCGIVPDFFTLFPLACIGAFAAAQGDWRVLVSAVVPFVPFAGTAALSRGRAMGWGDAKFAALGGAILGAQASLAAFALACLVAGVVAQCRGRRTTPVAFAPYLAVAIVLALAIGAYS